MASFEIAFKKTLANEGGLQLHVVNDDRGGQTFAGISRRYHPAWEGWAIIDVQSRDTNGVPSKKIENNELALLVKSFYENNFWHRIKGNEIKSQRVAESLFDFSVNAGLSTAVKMAQKIAGAAVDGIVGNQTIKKINAIDSDLFITSFTLKKIERYAEICRRDPVQKKFLLGWVLRSVFMASPEVLGGLDI